MATFNLIRNSRVFFTTNVAAGTGVINNSGFTTGNSQEITVLDGFTFSQGTNADTITISEAGSTPTRGQRTFNTSLNPVDFSFTTYIRPFLSTTVKADESCLWNALFGSYGIADSAAAVPFTFTGSVAVTYVAPRLTMTVTSVTAPTSSTTTFSSSTLVPGEIVQMKGAVGAGANEINSAVQVVSVGATSIVVDFLTAPPTATPANGNFGASNTVSFIRSSWVENAAVAADTPAVAYSEVTSAKSNVNQLLPFGMVFTVDGVSYAIDNAVMDQASIDFSLEGIASISWTGKAAAVRQLANNVTYSNASDPVIAGGTLSGTIKGRSATASTRYITNKLSTVSLKGNIGGIGAGNTSYNVALTGGNITIANNVGYITPANLGVVNIPIGYYTGQRSVTGTMNAYLRTGTNNTADLLNTLLTNSASSTETKFQLGINIGGAANLIKTEVLINGASLQIPTVDAQAVMSTVINFTAQGTDAILGASANYDIAATNDVRIRYFTN